MENEDGQTFLFTSHDENMIFCEKIHTIRRLTDTAQKAKK